MYALNRLISFLNEAGPVARLRLTRVRGSSPREAGTEMFVSATGLSGTIGGGQLEQRAIDAAREMLAKGDIACHLDLPLGPEIGQCCGGRVEISVQRMRMADKAAAISAARRAHDSLPSVYVLGAGHVGRALAICFSIFRCAPSSSTRARRDRALHGGGRNAGLRHPRGRGGQRPRRQRLRGADPPRARLPADLCGAREGDAAYVGMIGSATKRAKLRSWMRQHCDPCDFGRTAPSGRRATATNGPP